MKNKFKMQCVKAFV